MRMTRKNSDQQDRSAGVCCMERDREEIKTEDRERKRREREGERTEKHGNESE